MTAGVRVKTAHDREVLAFVRADGDEREVRVRWRRSRGLAWHCDEDGPQRWAECAHAVAVVMELAKETSNG